jgi:predicted amidohydrolase
MTLVAAATLAPVVGDLATNGRLGAAAIRTALDAGAKLIVLPELCTSGYVFGSKREAASAAIGADDPILVEWAEIARADGAVVVAGFCERGGSGQLYNSAVVLAAGEPVAVYRKTHLWDREKLIFTPGSEAPPVVDTHLGRLGVLICYDLEFPEMPRMLALAGADLLTVPTNWPLIARPVGEHPPEVIAAMAAARCSRLPIVCSDRADRERGVRFTGGASVIDSQGWVVASAPDGGLAMAELDLAAARNKRIGDRNDVFADRRPALYGAFTQLHTEGPAYV